MLNIIISFVIIVAIVLPIGLRGYKKQLEYEKTSCFYKWFRIVGSVALILYVILKYILKIRSAS